MFRHRSIQARRVPAPPPPESGDAQRIETVGELTSRIKAVLEEQVRPGWVRGEVSNLRAQASGHFYFSLKDASAQIACVMFRGDAARGGAARILRDGAQVIALGEISVYEPRGSYQWIVRVVVDDGLGRLQQEFERLKQRLAAEGLFAPERKRVLPPAPRTIGLITSPSGAAAQDFIRILKRRCWIGRVILLPVRVQGSGAAAEIVAALETAQALAASLEGPHFDLLVVGRGGGSLEDLWAFNEEPLVRAVAACALPVISAVGHEIDFTLCDLAADVRAETPSAAAELITSRYIEICERLRQAMLTLDAVADGTLRHRRDALEIARGRLALVSPVARIERWHLRLDDLGNRLTSAARHTMHRARQRTAEAAGRLAHVSPGPQVARLTERVRALGDRFQRATTLVLRQRTESVDRAGKKLRALDPAAVLRRGYVILRDEAQRPVVARRELTAGQHVTAQFSDGEAGLTADPK